MNGALRDQAADVPDGLLIVDKPPRLGSFDVIRRLKPLLGRRRKAGFLGTLDPFATGVLPLCVGEATKLADAVGEGEKEYLGEIALGVATDTGDVTGRVTRTASVPLLSDEDLSRASRAFLGPIEQVPPMYSAIHVGGERLYEKARRGEVVERAARTVTIHDLDLRMAARDRLLVRVVCSKGTYVRVLGEDLARHLGTEGHLVTLRRTRSGVFGVERAASLDELSSPDRAGAVTRASVPLDTIPFPGWRSLALSDAGFRRVANGRAVGPEGVDGDGVVPAEGERLLLRRHGHLVALAVGTGERGAFARPTRLLLRSDIDG